VRIMFVWLTCVSLCGMVTLGWYLSQTIILSIATALFTAPTGNALSLLTMIEYVNIWWGPIFDIVIVIWAIVSSQAQDTESVVYQ
jgi:hypothetical protein